MKMITRKVLAVIVIGFVAQACATSGPAKPSGPVELDGTSWKLVAMGGSLDGRVIAFKKRGSNGYLGKLTVPGRRLSNTVGVEVGTDIFVLITKGENQYEGSYKSWDTNGNMTEREVTLFVSGDNLTWNLENAVWERVQ